MKTKILFTLIALTTSTAAFAADEGATKTLPTVQSAEGSYAMHVGVHGGYVDPNGLFNPAIGYGVNLGFQPVIPFGLGLQGTFFNSQVDVPVGKAGVKRVDALIYMNYNFGGEGFISHMYAGAKMGAVFTTPYIENAAGTASNADTFTRFAIAPAIGFDCPFSDHRFSVGADVSYLFVVGPEMNMDSIQAMAALKYWF